MFLSKDNSFSQVTQSSDIKLMFLSITDGNREIIVPHQKFTQMQSRAEMQKQEVDNTILSTLIVIASLYSLI